MGKVIAIDGPSASGKGTVSKLVAQHLDYAYLDTGILYRAVALRVVGQDIDYENEALVVGVAKDLHYKNLEHPDLRQERIGNIASIISTYSSVRAELMRYQRHFAVNPPHGQGGAVLDGRDIGTIICPDADIKFFITATPQVRAQRRFDELVTRNPTIKYEDVLADIIKRDERDMSRNSAPLKKADDTILLDTTKLSITEVSKQILDAVSSIT